MRELTVAVLAVKGSTCHLCGLPGSDSPDHDPPRSELLAAGVVDPDQLRYLWPSHRLCNVRRKRRPITAQLRSELLARRLLELEQTTPPVSSRFAGLLGGAS